MKKMIKIMSDWFQQSNKIPKVVDKNIETDRIFSKYEIPTKNKWLQTEDSFGKMERGIEMNK